MTRAKHRYHLAPRRFNEAVDGTLAQVAKRTGVGLESVADADRLDSANLVARR